MTATLLLFVLTAQSPDALPQSWPPPPVGAEAPVPQQDEEVVDDTTDAEVRTAAAPAPRGGVVGNSMKRGVAGALASVGVVSALVLPALTAAGVVAAGLVATMYPGVMLALGAGFVALAATNLLTYGQEPTRGWGPALGAAFIVFPGLWLVGAAGLGVLLAVVGGVATPIAALAATLLTRRSASGTAVALSSLVGVAGPVLGVVGLGLSFLAATGLMGVALFRPVRQQAGDVDTNDNAPFFYGAFAVLGLGLTLPVLGALLSAPLQGIILAGSAFAAHVE